MAIHSENILIELARRDKVPGWVKELVYRTLRYGELPYESVEEVFEIFDKKGNAISSEPTLEVDEPLRLCSIKHLQGVNALRNGEEAKLCEEGITIFYGINGSGKSGYYRILHHLSGSPNAKDVLPNIYSDKGTSAIKAKIVCKLGDGCGKNTTFTWDNTASTKGLPPFNRISCFDSSSVHHLIHQHTPNTYVLDTQGAFSIRDFEVNLGMLITFCPDREVELELDKLLAIDFTVLYDAYLRTLKETFTNEVKKLIHRNLDVSIIKDRYDEPLIEIKLSKPYNVEDVLSEGELKAISLALFISEQEVKPIKDPIIFDDPVNSLDDELIARFERRLTEIENPIILFTHNHWFADKLISDKKRVKRYSCKSTFADRMASKRPLKHLIAYRITSWNNDKGIISEYEELSSKLYLDKAKTILGDKDYNDTKATNATSCLRKTIEYLVDERVFLGLKPCKYRSNHDSVNWMELKKLSRVPIKTIETLEDLYGRLSVGGEHLGFESIEMPLEHDELQEIYDELSKL